VGEQSDDFFDELVQIEIDRVELQLARFDLREVEDVVDQPE
jgi:hypothetical protein